MNSNFDDVYTGPNSRFSLNKGDVRFLDENGYVVGDTKSYFELKKLADTTYFDKLKVGDIVSLKSSVDEKLVVKYVDYHFDDFITSDYAGVRYDSDNKNLVLFGQDQIDKVYSDLHKQK